MQGGEFTGAASRLAGLSAVMFAWSPDAFWGATPAELGALVRAIAGSVGIEEATPPDGATIARLKEAHPDG